MVVLLRLKEKLKINSLWLTGQVIRELPSKLLYKIAGKED
ncbi:hypothetical protein HMPREF9418_0456 [Neisseria macacae ATCC 33926]|uniref:Uncharacterized protein n=1 Tax=Neisseria macacae ATCC 33926 TaxID=997348 RepID=A0AA36XMR4_9NEIS|nr:hypothetical protein HMPREF9418_0456 [Neisseria macacae ATCC 33926]